jgi:hypothetical protein
MMVNFMREKVHNIWIIIFVLPMFMNFMNRLIYAYKLRKNDTQNLHKSQGVFLCKRVANFYFYFFYINREYNYDLYST